MTLFEEIDMLIDKHLKREDLTADDILKLTIARRLNKCSDKTFAEAVGGAANVPPLNIWNRR